MDYQSGDYTYIIRTQKNIPPIGGVLHFNATVSHIFKNGDKIEHDFGQEFGKDEAEAEAKLKAKIELWISE